MNTKFARAIILVVCLVLLFFAVYPVWVAERESKHEFVKHQFLACVTTVCISDHRVGVGCEHLTPMVSKILIAVDATNPDYRSVIVEPTAAECK